MKRPSAYPYSIEEPPGATVHELRMAKDWTARQLAEKCSPPISHPTVTRLEQNQGFTWDTLKRVAKALGVAPHELFWPKEVREVMRFPAKERAVAIEAAIHALKRARS